MVSKKLSLTALALAAMACGKQTFLAAAFVQTPSVPNPIIASQPIPAFQVMTAYLGTIDTTSPTRIDAKKIGTVTGATAAVAFRHRKDPAAVASDADESRVLPIPEGSQPGMYLLSSKDQQRLTYEQDVPYTLILQTPGADTEAFGARMTPGPREGIQEFASTPVVDLALGKGFVVTRTDPAVPGGDRLPAFVVVGQIDPQNPTAEPKVTFKTVPADATALLKFVLSDRDYRWASYNVPATAFAGGGYFIVSVLTVTTGKVSDNAFLGSTALAATGAAGVVHVK